MKYELTEGRAAIYALCFVFCNDLREIRNLWTSRGVAKVLQVHKIRCKMGYLIP